MLGSTAPPQQVEEEPPHLDSPATPALGQGGGPQLPGRSTPGTRGCSRSPRRPLSSPGPQLSTPRPAPASEGVGGAGPDWDPMSTRTMFSAWSLVQAGQVQRRRRLSSWRRLRRSMTWSPRTRFSGLSTSQSLVFPPARSSSSAWPRLILSGNVKFGH